MLKHTCVNLVANLSLRISKDCAMRKDIRDGGKPDERRLSCFRVGPSPTWRRRNPILREERRLRHHATPSLKNRPAAEGRGKGLWDKIKSGGERISRSANKLARDEKYLPFLKLDSEQFSTNRRRLPGIRCRERPFKTQPLSKGVDSLPLPRASKLSFAF